MKYTSEHYKEMSSFFHTLSRQAKSKEDKQTAIILSVASALMFAEDNPKFNKHNYLKGCGLQ